MVLQLCSLIILACVASSLGQVIQEECTTKNSLTVQVLLNGEHEGGKWISISNAECATVADIGEILSPPLSCGDPHDLSVGFCKVFTDVGTRVTLCSEVNDQQVLYLVPFDRLFVWPAGDVGARIEIRPGYPELFPFEFVSMQIVSDSPRVFLIEDLITDEEAEELIRITLSETFEPRKLQRSAAGVSGSRSDSRRTSESAHNPDSPLSRIIKRRCLDLLGIAPYDDLLADGLEILRYNVSKAYMPHYDYVPSAEAYNNHNYESNSTGSNRFATFLLYLSEVREGGETVFSSVVPKLGRLYPDYGAQSRDDLLSQFDELGLTHNLPEDGWERQLLVDCRTKLSIKPRKTSVLLFYSQHPNGQLDIDSVHGGCPVLSGEKWVANLWVWNRPRATMSWQRTRGLYETLSHVTFESRDVPGAELHTNTDMWGVLEPGGQVIHADAAPGTRFVVRKRGKVLAEWIVDKRPSQRFVLKKSEIARSP